MITFKQFLLKSVSAKEIFDSVIAYFGLTKILKDARFILPDGTFLSSGSNTKTKKQMGEHEDVVFGFPKGAKSRYSGWEAFWYISVEATLHA
jgi:hypothetical protein